MGEGGNNMELTLKQTSFGTAIKCGNGLVAEYFIPTKGSNIRVKVNEKEYGALLEQLGYKVETVIDSHTGKTNWVAYFNNAKMPGDTQCNKFEKALSKLEYIHTKATAQVLAKKAARAQELKELRKDNKPTEVQKPQSVAKPQSKTSPRKASGKKQATSRRGK